MIVLSVVEFFRHIGTYSLFVQQLMQDGELIISDPLVDSNNRMLEVNFIYPKERHKGC
jgi:hypothetical protein